MEHTVFRLAPHAPKNRHSVVHIGAKPLGFLNRDVRQVLRIDVAAKLASDDAVHGLSPAAGSAACADRHTRHGARAYVQSKQTPGLISGNFDRGEGACRSPIAGTSGATDASAAAVDLQRLSALSAAFMRECPSHRPNHLGGKCRRIGHFRMH
jgi:hypothetical protein